MTQTKRRWKARERTLLHTAGGMQASMRQPSFSSFSRTHQKEHPRGQKLSPIGKSSPCELEFVVLISGLSGYDVQQPRGCQL